MERTRRQFTPQPKVAVLREHLVEHVPVSDLCDKHKLHPTLFYQRQKAFFENGAAAFESRRPRSRSLSKEEDKIAAAQKQDRGARRGRRRAGAHKKRAWGELSRGWVPHDTRDAVIELIKRLSARTEVSPRCLVGWRELSRSKY